MFGELERVTVHGDGPVWRIRLDDPRSGNLLDEAAVDELLGVLAGARADPTVRVLVFSGAGDDFCLGGGRDELTAPAPGSDPTVRMRRVSDKARRLCDALVSCPAVTVARLDGRSIGAGFALALHCDLRIGTARATFRLPELTFGLPLAWGGALSRLVAEVGAARIREMVLTGSVLDADAALRLSVLHQVVEPDALDGAVERIVRPILRRPAHAVAATKALLGAYGAAARIGDVGVLDAQVVAATFAAVSTPVGATEA